MSAEILQCADCSALGATRQWKDSPAYCTTCSGVRRMIYTSVDEAIRYEVPKADKTLLLATRARIAREGLGKVSLVNAIERRLRKLAKGAGR